jgi:hypothetical protein
MLKVDHRLGVFLKKFLIKSGSPARLSAHFRQPSNSVHFVSSKTPALPSKNISLHSTQTFRKKYVKEHTLRVCEIIIFLSVEKKEAR